MKNSIHARLSIIALIVIGVLIGLSAIIWSFSSRNTFTLGDEYRSVHPLFMEEGIIGDIAWSPDGNWIAYDAAEKGDLHAYDRIARTSEIYLARLDNGESLVVTSDKLDDSHPTWSPDNQTIVFASQSLDKPQTSYLRSLNVTSGETSALFNCQWRCYSPIWSSDGSWIAFQMAQNDPPTQWGIWLLNFQTRQAKLLISLDEYSRGLAWSLDSTAMFFVERRGASKTSPYKIISFSISNDAPNYYGDALSLDGDVCCPTRATSTNVFAYRREDYNSARMIYILPDLAPAKAVPLFERSLPGLVGDIALSPEATQLAFVLNANELYIMDVTP